MLCRSRPPSRRLHSGQGPRRAARCWAQRQFSRPLTLVRTCTVPEASRSSSAMARRRALVRARSLRWALVERGMAGLWLYVWRLYSRQMQNRQITDWSAQALSLQSERLGPLPLVNHFLERLGLEALLERFVPTLDRRVRLPYAKALLVLLRSVLVEREPLYRQGETVHGFCAAAFGLKADEMVSDDAIGQGLDRLFDADRAGLLTAVVVSATEAFDLRLSELHQDTTSISFCGQYREARGRRVRSRRAPLITYGFSKAHRPDLKQLLWVLTTTADGAVPVQFRCEDGNTSDSRTHAGTWDTLVKATGRTDFLYVADSKLCCEAAMDHIDRRAGRFVCVLPRSRSEDSEFREWLQTHEPAWELLWDRPNRRRQGGPRDRWWVHRALLPSHEGWPVVWVKSSSLELRRRQSRRERLLAATEALESLNARLAGPRPRRRSREQILQYLERVLHRYRVRRYLRVELAHELAHQFRQTRRGRPGPNTQYQRKSKKHWQVRFSIDEAAIAYDRKSDGMYPSCPARHDGYYAAPRIMPRRRRCARCVARSGT